MTEQERAVVITTLETYRSLDELKETIRRYGRVRVRTVARGQFAGQPAEWARVQADLKRAADDIDAEEMTL